jgi:arginyl-tRNA synthetase
VTVTPAALAAVAGQVTAAGPGCVTSGALAGVTVAAPPPGDPLAAAGWAPVRAALAARLTARLAAAAGATVSNREQSERVRATPGPVPPVPAAEITAAVAFAGRDAVLFTLARMIPGSRPRVDPRIIARHVPGNPAYAVRYAHARAASGVRWAANWPGGTTSSPGSGGPLPTGAAALLDALSWLPERVATAARRGRPDEFARYLEDLARVTVDVLSSASPPGDDRLALARAAQTGLGAGLGLLGVSAPDRLLRVAAPTVVDQPPLRAR